MTIYWAAAKTTDESLLRVIEYLLEISCAGRIFIAVIMPIDEVVRRIRNEGVNAMQRRMVIYEG